MKPKHLIIAAIVLLLLGGGVVTVGMIDKAKAKELLRAAARKWGIPEDWMLAIALTESRLRSNASNTSGPDGARGGAYGLTQITYKTAKAHGYTGTPQGLLDPIVNAEWAGKIMAAGRVSSFEDLAAWWNAGRRSIDSLSENHVTRTTYLPRALASLQLVQSGQV